MFCGVFAGEFGLQPEPSLVLSQLVQRHAGPSLPLARQPSPPTQQQAPAASVPSAPQHIGSPAQAAAKPAAPGAGLDPQGSSTPQQQRAQLKGPKRRIPPTSKAQNTFKVTLRWTSVYLVNVILFIKKLINNLFW